MPHPNAPDDDNSWDELARELGIDELSAKIDAAPVEDEPLAEEISESEEEGLIEAEPGAGTADDEGDEGDGEGDAEGGDELTGDEQPGTGRKRRRRRRRRRGKGAPGEAGSPDPAPPAVAETAETDVEEEAATEEFVPPRNTRTSRVEEEPEAEEEELETSGAPLAAEEDTGSEVLRELIATWNVPAWDDIVGGLYRPER